MKIQCIVFLLAVVWVLPVEAAEEGGKEPSRAGEIARWLPDKPAGPGMPIDHRESWERLAGEKGYRRVVAEAEAFTRKPLPEITDELYLDFSKTGNRSRYQAKEGRLFARFRTLVLAECLENRGRFIAPLEETIRALCALRTWVLPAHDRGLQNFHGETVDIDLHAAMFGWDLAVADYLLGHRLQPSVRETLRAEVQRRVLDPASDMIRDRRKKNWWMKTTNNWNPVCWSGVTGAALALLEGKDDRAFYVAAAEKYTRHFLEGFTPDGYCSEGVGYWNYGFGHFVLLAETILQATRGKVDLLAAPAVRAPATYGARIEIVNGVYPSFADCSVGTRPVRELMVFLDRRFELGLPGYRVPPPPEPRFTLYATLLYDFPHSSSPRPAGPAPALEVGLRSWFSEAGLLVCRLDEGVHSEFGVAMKGGHNAEHHNHNDVGTYTVICGNVPVLLDPGAEVYTSRTFSSRRYDSKVLNSYGHPVPRVAGVLQKTGRNARARLIKQEFTENADTLDLDLTSAYPVKELEQLTRRFVFSREAKGSLTVTDTVRFVGAQSFGTALVTLGEWEPAGKDRLVVRYNDRSVYVDIDTGGNPYEVRAEEIREDVRTSRLPTRLGIELKEPVQQATVSLRIYPG
jgi:hypothetical protein